MQAVPLLERLHGVDHDHVQKQNCTFSFLQQPNYRGLSRSPEAALSGLPWLDTYPAETD